jgi:hypothetical protein
MDAEQIKCPRNPDHGIVIKWWLAPEDRELLTKFSGDVYAIKCDYCGEYEVQLNPSWFGPSAKV